MKTILWSSREDVVRTADLFGNMNFKVHLKDPKKTSREGHLYFIEGDIGVAGDSRVDPVLAVALYCLVRGEEDGYLFCRFAPTCSGAFEIRADVRSTNKDFLEELWSSVDDAGV
eukprot:contig_6926_g1598